MSGTLTTYVHDVTKNPSPEYLKRVYRFAFGTIRLTTWALRRGYSDIESIGNSSITLVWQYNHYYLYLATDGHAVLGPNGFLHYAKVPTHKEALDAFEQLRAMLLSNH